MEIGFSHCVTCMCSNCESQKFPRPSCYQISTIYQEFDIFQICSKCLDKLIADRKNIIRIYEENCGINKSEGEIK